MTQTNSPGGIAGIKSATTTNPTQGTVTPTPASENKTTGTTSTTKKTSTSQTIGQEDFLKLLVNQLQHQDPLNPMDNQEFAVQLAQFSSLEQLIQMNKKLGDSGSTTSAAGTMASYLGNEVLLNSSDFSVTKGQGPNLSVNIPNGTQSVRVDFNDAQGKVVGRKYIENFQTGKQVLKMDDLTVPNGTYTTRVVSVDAKGSFVDLQAKVSGTVEGFVVQPQPKLIVNGKEVSLDDVMEVHKAV